MAYLSDIISRIWILYSSYNFFKIVLTSMMRNMAKICEFCGTSSEHFTGKMSFWHHVKIYEKTASQCHCGKVFNSKMKLKRHQKPVHPEAVNCSCCDQLFSTLHNLNQHQQSQGFEGIWQIWKVKSMVNTY